VVGAALALASALALTGARRLQHHGGPGYIVGRVAVAALCCLPLIVSGVVNHSLRFLILALRAGFLYLGAAPGFGRS
jgi:hypothetical protein